jgi:hypothetical protein
MVKIRQYVLDGEVETLRRISQNNVYSAWFNCDFGGCELGVFSTTMPVEALHAVEVGICKDAAAILFVEDLEDANVDGFVCHGQATLHDLQFQQSHATHPLQGWSNQLGEISLRARHWNPTDRRDHNSDRPGQTPTTDSLCAGQSAGRRGSGH